MGAQQGTGSSTGRKNYYSISYGKLTTKIKEVPENHTELVEAELKERIQKVEQIDFRNKYVNKGKGDYPYQVFYDSLTGVISAQEKVENDHGVFLNLTVEDTDGDTSIIQMNFYSKYAENILNRLLNVEQGKEMRFFPYALPQTAEIDGVNKSFYTQGVSLKVGETKIEPKYKNDDPKLPPTEVVKVKGKATTSRDNRVDFLYEEFTKVFQPGEPTTVTTQASVKQESAVPQDTAKSDIAQPVANQQLPF